MVEAMKLDTEANETILSTRCGNFQKRKIYCTLL